MAAPKFEDISKAAQDLFKDDYTTKAVAKIKYNVPGDVTITSETEYSPTDKKLLGKLVAKWKSSSGFALDKFQIKSDAQYGIETSLTGVAPGLKFNFKGDDDKLGVLGVDYSTPSLTATGDLDVVGFEKLNFSALGAYKGFKLGGDVSLDLASKTAKSYSYGLAYSKCKYFLGVTSKNSSGFDGSFYYDLSPVIRFGTLLSYSKAKTSYLATFGWSHKCAPSTTYKAKADSSGKVSAAVTYNYAKGAALTSSAETTVSSPKDVKLGFTLTLG